MNDEAHQDFPRALQHVRVERGLTQPALAKKIHVSRALISLWEIGERTPSRDQIDAMEGALGSEGLLAEAFDGSSGLSFSDSWEETRTAVTNLWRHDMARRGFLRSAAFNVAALATPLAAWADSTRRSDPAGDGDRQIGTPEIDMIATVTQAFRGLDNRHGGAHAREAVVSFLHTEVTPLLTNGRFTPTAGARLLSRVAELNQLAGWMSYDTGYHGVAQRYFTQALRLAKTAGDVPLGAEILAAMAHQAAFLGHGRHAVDLGAAAMRTATRIEAHALVSEAATMTAHGHALTGDTSASATLLLQAEQQLDGNGRADEPQWLSYYDNAYLSAKKGHCLLAAGDVKPAIDAARKSLDMNSSYVRGRMFNLCLLATGLADAGEPEEACTHAREALTVKESLRSARADVYVDRLVRALQPYTSSPDVQELLAQAGHATS